MIVVLRSLDFGMNIALFEMFVAFIGILEFLHKSKCFVLYDFTIYSDFCCVPVTKVEFSLRYTN